MPRFSYQSERADITGVLRPFIKPIGNVNGILVKTRDFFIAFERKITSRTNEQSKLNPENFKNECSSKIPFEFSLLIDMIVDKLLLI